MRRVPLLVLTVLGVLSAVGCGGSAAFRPPASASDFDPGRFTSPTTIDNPWLPLQPGRQWAWEGMTIEGGRRVPHRLVSTVTDLTKTIDNVRSLVIWERDFSAGELVEAEIAFFAQDADGNVWLMGEYPEEYEQGAVVDAPTWLSGVEGARAGIAMLSEPRPGEPDYAEGYAPPPVDFTDRARTSATGRRTCVPLGCYEDVLVIDEFNPDEPGRHQLKYYARRVGNVRVGWSGGKEASKEVLGLTSIEKLGAAALARARAGALKLEKHAYETSEAVYARTPPLERLRPPSAQDANG